jgi:hypothetical protein
MSAPDPNFTAGNGITDHVPEEENSIELAPELRQIAEQVLNTTKLARAARRIPRR